MLLGWLLGPLGSLLEASWGHHKASWQPLGALGELLGSLGGLLGSFWRPLGVSWRPLGALGELLGSLGSLLAASWGSLGTSWLPWKRKSSPGSSGSMIFEAPRRPPWRENGPGSSGSRIFRGPPGGRTSSTNVQGERRERAAGAFRDPPPSPKALAKAKATTIMSLLSSELVY